MSPFTDEETKGQELELPPPGHTAGQQHSQDSYLARLSHSRPSPPHHFLTLVSPYVMHGLHLSRVHLAGSFHTRSSIVSGKMGSGGNAVLPGGAPVLCDVHPLTAGTEQRSHHAVVITRAMVPPGTSGCLSTPAIQGNAHPLSVSCKSPLRLLFWRTPPALF